MELNVSEDPRAIAPHLRAAFSHAPELNRASGACFVGQLARLGGWQEPERRLALIAAAARAWPERGRPRSELFASATREAFVQRRWRDGFRLARGLCSPTGLGVVARMAYRRTPFGRPGRMAG